MKSRYFFSRILLVLSLLSYRMATAQTQTVASSTTVAAETGKDVKQIKPDSLSQVLALRDILALGYKGGDIDRAMALKVMRLVRDKLTVTDPKKKALWKNRLDTALSSKRKRTDSLNRKVVFIYVPADAAKLKGQDKPTNIATLRANYTAVKDKPESVRSALKSDDDKFVKQIALTKQAIVAAVQSGDGGVLKNKSEQAELLATERKRTKEFNEAALKTAVGDSTKAWNALFFLQPRYIEPGKPQSIVFGKKRDLDYLSQVREGLIVVVGNSDSLRNLSLFVKKEDRIIKAEAADVPLIVKAVTGGEALKDVTTSEPEESTIKQDVAVRLFFIDSTQTSPTYSMTAATRGGRFTYKVHEPVFFRLKLGFAAGSQDVNYFKLQNQQLVFGPDSLRKQDIKANLTLMLDFSPWPRHIDYLRPFRVWESVFSRLSFGTGLKIGKDPFESLYGGVNYAITKDISLSTGIAWHSNELTNIEPINTPSNIVGYLRNNEGRGYNRRFFLGIALSPSAIIKVLGLKKEE